MIKNYHVEIPVSKQVKAYIENNYGNNVPLITSSAFNSLLQMALSHRQKQHVKRVSKKLVLLKIQLPFCYMARFGAYVNPLQGSQFNNVIDSMLRTIVVEYIKSYMDSRENPKFKNAVEYALDRLNISIEDWDYDSISKFYYRYRTKTYATNAKILNTNIENMGK